MRDPACRITQPILRLLIVNEFSQVAMHLSETYGDRAFSVVRGASITGKRWPIVGKRLHDEYPYIEAEVSSVGQLVRAL